MEWPKTRTSVQPKQGGKMKPTYEELEIELLKSIGEIAPEFQEEWMPHLMLDVLEEGVFGTERKDQ